MKAISGERQVGNAGTAPVEIDTEQLSAFGVFAGLKKCIEDIDAPS